MSADMTFQPTPFDADECDHPARMWQDSFGICTHPDHDTDFSIETEADAHTETTTGSRWSSKALDKQYEFAWPSAWSRDRENEILPGLWIGGLQAAGAATSRYNLIVNLNGNAQPFNMNGTPEIVWPIGDGATLPDLNTLWKIARTVRDFLRASPSAQVLVHCAAGINRSALLCACVVMLMRGVNGATAMRIVRAARKGALANPAFDRYLSAHPQPSAARRRGLKVRE